MRYLQVSVTFPSEEIAKDISDVLLNERLVSCYQLIGPIISRYHWQGKIETAQEYLCLFKTIEPLYPRFEKTVLNLHPYNTPEIIAVEIVSGFSDYLNWIREETQSQ